MYDHMYCKKRDQGAVARLFHQKQKKIMQGLLGVRRVDE